MSDLCPKCGNRLQFCGCTFTLEERGRLFAAPIEVSVSFGTCGDEVDAAYAEMKAREAEIHAERARLTEAGFDHRFEFLAYLNQTKNELAAIERDLFKMSFVTGLSSLCRKHRRVSASGPCRDCRRFERGLERLGGRRAATSIEREPGDELDPWVLGWIAGLDGVSECAFSGKEKAEWDWWRERAVEWMDGKTREQVRAEIKSET